MEPTSPIFPAQRTSSASQHPHPPKLFSRCVDAQRPEPHGVMSLLSSLGAARPLARAVGLVAVGWVREVRVTAASPRWRRWAGPAAASNARSMRCCRLRSTLCPRRAPCCWCAACYQSLLEFAEACNVPTRWSCRTGVCHTCETGLLSGVVAYSPEPVERLGALRRRGALGSTRSTAGQLPGASPPVAPPAPTAAPAGASSRLLQSPADCAPRWSNSSSHRSLRRPPFGRTQVMPVYIISAIECSHTERFSLIRVSAITKQSRKNVGRVIG